VHQLCKWLVVRVCACPDYTMNSKCRVDLKYTVATPWSRPVSTKTTYCVLILMNGNQLTELFLNIALRGLYHVDRADKGPGKNHLHQTKRPPGDDGVF
jgi:hypothetical protein